MKALRKITALCLCLISLMAFTPVFAAEASEFTLFVSEFNLPLDGNSRKGAPEWLDNVPLAKLPQSLADCFGGLGHFNTHLMGTDESGNPYMTKDDLDKLTFTGPYYRLSMIDKIKSPDIESFLKCFAEDSILMYLIRLEDSPAGILHTAYDNGKYEFKWVSDHIDAGLMAKQLDMLSGSKRLTNDVFFLGIRAERYLISADNQVFASMRMDEPASFINLVKAEYVAKKEYDALVRANGGVDDIGGGSSAIAYIYNPDDYIAAYAATSSRRQLILGGIGLVLVTVVGYRWLKRRRKA